MVILYLDVTMLPMAAYQNVDDNCNGFKLDRDQIKLVTLLGSGNFGQVSKAIYGPVVAVKTLKGNYISCNHGLSNLKVSIYIIYFFVVIK